MTELRDLRVPGLGLAPMKPTDDLYPRDHDPVIAEFLWSKRRQPRPFALRTAAQGAPRVHPRGGLTFGHVTR